MTDARAHGPEHDRQHLVRAVRRALVYLDKPRPTDRERLSVRHRLRGTLSYVGEDPDGKAAQEESRSR